MLALRLVVSVVREPPLMIWPVAGSYCGWPDSLVWRWRVMLAPPRSTFVRRYGMTAVYC